MATKVERVQARWLLDCRANGYSIRAHVRIMKNAYFASALSGVFCVIFFYFSFGREWMAWVALGGLAGLLLRDTNWYYGCVKGWPMTERIIDWAKVEAIAQEPDAPPADENPLKQSE
jgi:hypothetical protein